MTLRGGALCDCHTPQGTTQNILHVIGRANVAGASFHRCDPQLFIWYAVGADNRQRRKVVVQVAHISETRVFHIENHDLWPVLGDSLAKFVAAGAGKLLSFQDRSSAH